MAGHTKRWETSLAVALIPGWLRKCRELNIYLMAERRWDVWAWFTRRGVKVQLD
jgi:hypothetical protein